MQSSDRRSQSHSASRPRGNSELRPRRGGCKRYGHRTARRRSIDQGGTRKPTDRDQAATAAHCSPFAVGAVTRAVGGTVAGDARRWADEPRRLAIVVGSEDPAEIQSRFAAVDDIVLVQERRRADAQGASPSTSVVSDPQVQFRAPAGGGAERLRRFTWSLARSTGWAKTSLYRALALPFLEPELREAPPPDPIGAIVELKDPYVEICTVTPSGRTARQRCSSSRPPRAAAATTTSRSATTPDVASFPGLDGDDLRRQANIEISAANEQQETPFGSLAEANATSAQMARSIFPTTCWPASNGSNCRSTRVNGRRGGDSTAAR